MENTFYFLKTEYLLVTVLFLLPMSYSTWNMDISFSSFNKSCHAKYHSCKSPHSLALSCHCDPLCVYYDDCCFDADTILEEITLADDIEKTPLPFLRETRCEQISFKEKTPSKLGAFMVSACPTSWKGDKIVKYKCEQKTVIEFLDLIPVHDINTNINFLNRHCALCHNVHDWVPWLLNITCNNHATLDDSPFSASLKDAIMLKLNNTECKYRFEPSKDIFVRYCFRELKYMLWSVLNEVKNTSCENRVLSPFSFSHVMKTKVFRNWQCFKDDDLYSIHSLKRGMVLCFLPSVEKSEAVATTISSLVDVSSLFIKHEKKTPCNEMEIFLSDKVGCRTLFCPTDMEADGGRCTAIRYKTRGIPLDLLFESNAVIDRDFTFNHFIDTVLEKIAKGLDSITLTLSDLVYMQFWTKFIKGYHVTSLKPCSLIQVQYILQEKLSSNVSFEHKRLVVTNLIRNYQQNFSNGILFNHVDDVMKSFCECNISLKNPQYVLHQFPHVSSLPCPAVRVYPQTKHTENPYLDSNIPNNSNTVYRQDFYLNETTIESMDVFFNTGNYFICVETFLSKYKFIKENDQTLVYYRYIANTTCTSLSIASLIYSLIQYCVIPVIRQGKSELLFLLMTYLVFAQISFVLISHITVGSAWCEWIGVFHHFIWVGTFILMFLCSFRLNSEIRSLKTIPRSERFWKTFQYCFVGFVLNVSIVLGTKLSNIFLSPMETWYGGDICFITHTYVLLLSFVIPIFFFLCGNVVLFVLIVHYIQSTSISSSTEASQSSTVLLIKISSMMGLSWIFSIFAMFVQSEILLILSENISSLQGIFVTLSFSCNNRVTRFYRDICSTKQRSDSEKTRSTSANIRSR